MRAKQFFVLTTTKSRVKLLPYFYQIINTENLLFKCSYNIGTTKPSNFKSGVPQGYILGPTLVFMFLICLHLFIILIILHVWSQEHITEKIIF